MVGKRGATWVRYPKTVFLDGTIYTIILFSYFWSMSEVRYMNFFNFIHLRKKYVLLPALFFFFLQNFLYCDDYFEGKKK